jgi:hypothetical protein
MISALPVRKSWRRGRLQFLKSMAPAIFRSPKTPRHTAAWADAVISGGTIVSTSGSPSASLVFANPSQADALDNCGTGITIPANGVGIAVASQGSVSTGTPLTWSANGGVAVASVAGMPNGIDVSAIDGGSSSTAGTIKPIFQSAGAIWGSQVPTCSLVSWGP